MGEDFEKKLKRTIKTFKKEELAGMYIISNRYQTEYKGKIIEQEKEISQLKETIKNIKNEVPEFKTYFNRNNVSVSQIKWKKVNDLCEEALKEEVCEINTR